MSHDKNMDIIVFHTNILAIFNIICHRVNFSLWHNSIHGHGQCYKKGQRSSLNETNKN